MTIGTDAPARHELARPAKSAGEVYEGLAFTFCKAAVIILFTQRFALAVAAGAAAVFYVLAYRHGQRTTRCRGPRAPGDRRVLERGRSDFVLHHPAAHDGPGLSAC